MLRHKLIMLLALATITTLSVFSTNASAQCNNANVIRAFQMVAGRAPYSDRDWNECTLVGNVNGLSQSAIIEKVIGAGVCADPWITKAYFSLSPKRIPAGWGTTNECNKLLYAEGRWSSYNQLRDSVSNYLSDLSLTGNRFVSVLDQAQKPRVIGALGNSARPADKLESEITGDALVGNDGASVLSTGGGGLKALGGGQVVPTGAGSLISNATQNFANISIPQRLPFATNTKRMRGKLRLRF